METNTLTAEVKEYNGTPTMFIRGKPHTGLTFYAADVVSPIGKKRVTEFAEVGVHLVQTQVSAVAGISDGNPDSAFEHLDTVMHALIEANPEVLALPRVHIVPGKEWQEQHPEEIAVHINPETGAEFRDGCTCGVSLTSRLWKEDAGPALRAFVRYAEAQYGAHIAGYHLDAGAAAEWSHLWDPGISDYSPAHTAAFREWLKNKYDADEDALRKAWADPNAAFDIVEVPRDRFRTPHDMSLLDPAREKRIIDYLKFHSEGVAHTILYFADIVKSELGSMDSVKLCGTFFGYYFWDAGWPCGIHNSGHHALPRLLASPDIDFICAPYSYQERVPGGMFHSQCAAGSIRINGKLFLNEDDTCTHLGTARRGTGMCKDLADSLGVIRRNFAGVAMTGGTQWWMDIISEGVFNDPPILEEIAGLVQLADKRLEMDRAPCTQTALIVSRKSLRYERYDTALTDALVPRQMSELTSMGVPFETFLTDDIEKLCSAPDSERFRLLIFVNCVYLSTEERDAIRKYATRSKRVLLWIYGAGLVTDQGISLEAMHEVTGIRVGRWERAWPSKAVSYLTGEPITYGTDAYIEPWLYVTDPNAVVHGTMLGKTNQDVSHAPGLAQKDMGDWTSIVSTAPALPATVLREIARRANVHVYTRNGDQPFVMPGFLAVHARSHGERTVYLPERMDVTDACTGAPVASRASEISTVMRKGDTAFWRVEACT